MPAGLYLFLENITIAAVSAPAAAPAITGLSPAAGPVAGGTSVVISGTDFTGTTAVKFGASDAASFTVDSPTQNHRSLTRPRGRNRGRQSHDAAGASAITAADQFYYYPNLSIVTGISPSSGYAMGGDQVVITGYNLSGTTAVKFGTSDAASFTVDSPIQITAASPAHAVGTVDVRVTTPLGDQCDHCR